RLFLAPAPGGGLVIHELAPKGLRSPPRELAGLPQSRSFWTTTTAAFDPQGRWLAIPGPEQAVRLWDLSDLGEPRRLPNCPSGSPYSLPFSAAGDRLAAFDGGSACFWTIAQRDQDPLIELARRTAGRNLSRREWAQYFPDQERYRKTFDDLPEAPDDLSSAEPGVASMFSQQSGRHPYRATYLE